MQKPVLISEILGLDLDMSNHDDNVEKRYAYIKQQLEKDPNWVGYERLEYASFNNTLITPYDFLIIDTNGQLYRVKRQGHWFPLKPIISNVGYPSYNVTLGSVEKKYFSAHRCVGSTFVPLPDRHQNKERKDLHVNHIDGNKSNANVLNFEWTTIAENVQHSVANGFQKSGLDHPDARAFVAEVMMYGPYKGLRFIMAGNKMILGNGLASSSIKEQIEQNNPNRSLKWVHGCKWGNATEEDIENCPVGLPDGYLDYYNANRNIADPKSNVSIGEILKGPHTGFKFFLVGGKEIQSYGFGQDKVSRAASWGTKDPETRKKDGDIYRGIRWSYGTWDDVDELGLERGISKEMVETIK